MFNWLLDLNTAGRKRPPFEQSVSFVDRGMINSSKLEASTFRAIGQVARMIRAGTMLLSKRFMGCSNRFLAFA